MPTRVKTQDIADLAITPNKLSVPTTKGDLLGYDTAPARVPVGTNGYILTADSEQALGLKWSAPSSNVIFVDSEVPSGTVNGTNAAFTLTNTPTSGSVHLHKNGLRQSPTTDYTISGGTITFVSGNIPQTGDVLLVDYRRT
jgi:hypothetical protein